MNWKRIVVWGALIIAFFFLVPPIVQNQSYHLFADSRTILRIPNCWNVLSNLPFVIVGLLGLWNLRGTANCVLFTGVLLTGLGSSYYHLAPSDSRLVWDRLPMTVVFMSVLASALAGENNLRNQIRTLAMFVAFGIASVIWWSWTGDLRLYVLVQFGSLLLLVPSLRFVPNGRFLAAVVAFYAFAKAAEFGDHAMFGVLPVSGHTTKHLLSEIATYLIYRWQISVASSGDARSKALPVPEPIHL